MVAFANRYVAITREGSTYGTAAGTRKYGEVDSESISHVQEVSYRNDMGYHAITKSVGGKEYSEGDLTLVYQSDDCTGLLLAGFMGHDTESSSNHTMTDGAANDPPSFNLEIGREDKEHTYSGCVIDRISVTGSIGEYVMLTASFVGRSESSLTALATPTFDGITKEGMHFHGAEVKFNSDSTASDLVKSFSLEMTNNVDTDNACVLGNRTYVRKPEPTRREITGSVTFTQPILMDSVPSSPAQQSEPQYEDFIAAGGLEVNPDASSANTAIQFKFTDGDSNMAQINIHKVRWEAATLNVSGRDAAEYTLNFTAMLDKEGSNPSNSLFNIYHEGIASGTAYTAM